LNLQVWQEFVCSRGVVAALFYEVKRRQAEACPTVRFSMPVVGTTAYNTAGQITALVRSLLNDAAGNLFTDSVLLPFVNSGYRKAQRALANVQSGSFLSDNVLLVVQAVASVDPSVQVSITDATAPPNQLPPDLLVPVKIWERSNLSSDDFVEMVDLTDHDGLPSEPQGQALSYWEWRADGIYFLGATRDTQIRLRYQKSYPDLTDATSPVLIRNAQEALAYAAAAMAGAARGAPQAVRWDAAAADALEDLVVRATQREQQPGRRRRPFSSRAGFAPLI
jgi:hypothetical protein